MLMLMTMTKIVERGLDVDTTSDNDDNKGGQGSWY